MSYKIIDSKLWERCTICGVGIKDMPSPKEKGKPCYKSEKFKYHIVGTHSMTLSDYFNGQNIEKVGLCQCGCGGLAPVIQLSKNLVVGNFLRWHSTANSPGFLAFVEREKEERKGIGNPMFGLKPWNKGLTKETSPCVLSIARKLEGKPLSSEHRNKISRSWLYRDVAGHNMPHSEETKKRLSQITLNNIKKGVFSQTRTKPHIAFSLILLELDLEFEEEKTNGVFSFDFYIKDLDLYVEVDGDYFHANPAFYPEGPKTATQKINCYRDRKKNEHCERSLLKLQRFWECDILKRREEVRKVMRGHIDARRTSSTI